MQTTERPAFKPAPERTYFRRKYCPEPRALGPSLGSGDGQLEIAAVEAGICERIIGIDIAPERVRRATERVPAHLRDRVSFVCENLETYRPDQQFDVIFAKSILHHIDALECWCDAFDVLLGQGGLLYVDDFIGPSRFQWTDSQIYVINRLLDTLPEPLRRDLVLADGSPRAPVARPNVDKFIAADPSEAIRSSDMLMEVDFLLTDIGALDPDYLWGVYRPAQ